MKRDDTLLPLYPYMIFCNSVKDSTGSHIDVDRMVFQWKSSDNIDVDIAKSIIGKYFPEIETSIGKHFITITAYYPSTT